MKNLFSLVGSRYIFCGSVQVCTVMESGYSEPLLDILNKMHPKDYALSILAKMMKKSRISGMLREPTESDKTIATAQLRPDATAKSEKYGKKHVCVYCQQKFYDLNGRVTKCPQCETTIF